MHPTTWKASGHVDAFNDPLIDNKDSKKRYRADVLIEDYCRKTRGILKLEKEVSQSAKDVLVIVFNDRAQFIATNPRVVEANLQQKGAAILTTNGADLWRNEDLADV